MWEMHENFRFLNFGLLMDWAYSSHSADINVHLKHRRIQNPVKHLRESLL